MRAGAPPNCGSGQGIDRIGDGEGVHHCRRGGGLCQFLVGGALWSDAAGTRWHLSTAADSIVLGGPDSSTIQVLEIEPAKGGGFAGIEVGPWSVRSAWLSRAIADAARELEKLPGLTVERHQGHDV